MENLIEAQKAFVSCHNYNDTVFEQQHQNGVLNL